MTLCGRRAVDSVSAYGHDDSDNRISELPLNICNFL
jgi:hypothetical protein